MANPYMTVAFDGRGDETRETPDTMFDAAGASGHRVAATKTHAARVTPASVAALGRGGAVDFHQMYDTVATDGDGHDLATHRARVVRNRQQEYARQAALNATDPHTLAISVVRSSLAPEFRAIRQYPRRGGAGTV